MFPKYSLFHVCILALRAFNFCWNWYILVPMGGTSSYHHFYTRASKYLFSSQNCSKMNDFLIRWSYQSHWRQIDQQSYPAVGRKLDEISPTSLAMSFDTNFLYSRGHMMLCTLSVILCKPPISCLHVNTLTLFHKVSKSFLESILTPPPPLLFSQGCYQIEILSHYPWCILDLIFYPSQEI